MLLVCVITLHAGPDAESETVEELSGAGQGISRCALAEEKENMDALIQYRTQTIFILLNIYICQKLPSTLSALTIYWISYSCLSRPLAPL